MREGHQGGGDVHLPVLQHERHPSSRRGSVHSPVPAPRCLVLGGLGVVEANWTGKVLGRPGGDVIEEQREVNGLDQGPVEGLQQGADPRVVESACGREWGG